jgi:lipopolysaccharide export system protein LptA
MKAYVRLPTALSLLVLLAPMAPARAEHADREKPVNLEANRITVDDAKRTQILEGNVLVVRGTMVIHADRVIVTQDDRGYQKAVAYGPPGGKAHFRQKREASDEYVEGEAERIEHDGHSDKTEFFNQAYVKSGRDEMRGQYVAFDGQTENYLVTGGPANASGHTEPVHAVIAPKNVGTAAAPAAVPASAVPTLKPAAEITPPGRTE